jgi:hypothetical protein
LNVQRDFLQRYKQSYCDFFLKIKQKDPYLTNIGEVLRKLSVTEDVKNRDKDNLAHMS